jgi:hypothetical protein
MLNSIIRSYDKIDMIRSSNKICIVDDDNIITIVSIIFSLINISLYIYLTSKYKYVIIFILF